MHPAMYLVRASLAAAAVIGATIGGAAVGAYLAMWLAASIDPTMGGWIGVFFVALPVGLLIGGAVGLYGSLWLIGRRKVG
jgi:MFS family permease